MNLEFPRSGRLFAQHFSSTRRGARLARHLTLHQLDVWGFPYGCELSENAALVVTELAANAVLHGHVPGRDFAVRLAYPGELGRLRIEVSDARGERRLDARAPLPAPPDAEGGRGLLLMVTLALAWGVREREVGKTVWAELR